MTIKEIRDSIEKGEWNKRAENTWGGADVVITAERIPENPGDWYGGYLQVVTEHAYEASALMADLREAAGKWYDFASKYVYFGTIGEYAVKYLEAHNDLKGLLLAMCDGALAVEEEALSYEKAHK